MEPRGKDRSKEADRILRRLDQDIGLHGKEKIIRTVDRARDHLAGADADPDDRIEVWGTRIGRLLGLAAFILLLIWLALYLMHSR